VLSMKPGVIFLFLSIVEHQQNVDRRRFPYPAAFFLSIFNAPIALASIALNLTAVYAADESRACPRQRKPLPW
jgi:hypothetical protein